SAAAPSRGFTVSSADRADVPAGGPQGSTPRHLTDPATAPPPTRAIQPPVAPPGPDHRLASPQVPPRPPPPHPRHTPLPPTAAPRSPAPSLPSSVPPTTGATGRPTTQSRAAVGLVGPSLLSWLAFAVVATLVSQVVRLGLRPLRRLVTLRHLRRPFWDE